jgi:energy-coupling factor transporter ATP-binding protein EcfA2
MQTMTTQSEGRKINERRQSQLPPSPNDVEETGLSFQFLIELITKCLFLRGEMRLLDLVGFLKLPVPVLNTILDFMRKEHICEHDRSSGTEITVTYRLTEIGRLRAQDYLNKSQYIGPAPVSLTAYLKQVKEQSVANMLVTRDQLKKAFANIVVKEGVLKQFGAAMNSGRAIFVYGPSGSGKTFIAEHLAKVLTGDVAIPHAIAVDSEVIQVFDPLLHFSLLTEASVDHDGVIFDRRMATDSRWVMCHRPVIKVGGELTLAMLDLDFDESAGFYQAPPHMKANNGLLIIDDLGRQLVPAVDIMNRWIVPLDRHMDYLALHTGKKFNIPFDVIVIFSTNLLPSELADEAFLRRIGYKIYMGPMLEEDYRVITEQVCQELEITFNEDSFNYLLQEYHYKRNQPLYACIPRDILEQIKDISHYEGEAPVMSKDMLDWAWGNYFAHD